MRIAVIKEAECEAPDNCNYICAEVCPRVREGFKETVYAKPNGKAAITESLCISCGICVKRCPFDAIRIINLPDEMAKELTFQYALNSFRTFNIATPVEKKVLGLIGRNGIGKTTNIRLISGVIKPNFGNFDQPPSEQEVIKRFRGSEIQPYLTNLYTGKTRISVKKQDFKLSGKVGDIIKLNRYGLISQTIMERSAETLSGGESQMVEIARVLDEDAEIYIFDEPMNYLDIKNRLLVARKIKEALGDKTVVVVEHDLIMMDYLADFIQILYGSDANYGIVSHLMPSRNGINTYISGYLPTENVRFRDYEIKIKKTVSSSNEKTVVVWPEFSVKIGEFTLKSRGGKLYGGDVIGVLGENGIGKTTFMRALAGELETTDGSRLDLGIKIAYKPQMIETKDILVGDALLAVDPNYVKKQEILEIVSKLGLNKLLNKNVKTLSGGELQKLAIATALMREADVYLFDEPSANLDIEDRLGVISIISNSMSTRRKCAIIVEHDLMFIDSICQKSILFSGQSGKLGMTDEIIPTNKAINNFLKSVDVTMRRDRDSKRPRINQPGSRLDLEQKEKGMFFAD
ncbi:MAG: ribosome biogenesis/translation initiation ATPase RLI [Candidatus Parvarchaeota archaeon]|nr:ribosome biogenesis/translation initiation ATPase RLI [Candidatus Parvarchaeota archaeon]